MIKDAHSPGSRDGRPTRKVPGTHLWSFVGHSSLALDREWDPATTPQAASPFLSVGSLQLPFCTDLCNPEDRIRCPVEVEILEVFLAQYRPQTGIQLLLEAGVGFAGLPPAGRMTGVGRAAPIQVEFETVGVVGLCQGALSYQVPLPRRDLAVSCGSPGGARLCESV